MLLVFRQLNFNMKKILITIFTCLFSMSAMSQTSNQDLNEEVRKTIKIRSDIDTNRSNNKMPTNFLIGMCTMAQGNSRCNLSEANTNLTTKKTTGESWGYFLETSSITEQYGLGHNGHMSTLYVSKPQPIRYKIIDNNNVEVIHGLNGCEITYQYKKIDKNTVSRLGTNITSNCDDVNQSIFKSNSKQWSEPQRMYPLANRFPELASSPSQSQTQPSQSQANPDVEIKYANGDFYLGKVRNGVQDGYGGYWFSSRSELVSTTWSNGKMVNGSEASLKYTSAEKRSLPQISGKIIDGKFVPNQTTTTQPSQSQANPDVRINYTNGDVYFGQVKDGKPSGQGTFTWANGGRYVGQFKNGQRNGQGTSTFKDGSSYVGEFKDDKFNGQGTLTLKDVSRYVGGWKDGKRNGQGTSTSSTSIYVGEFKDDKYNGRGTLTLKGFSSYVGEFKDGESNGQGTLTVNDLFSYVGEFKDNKMNGRGTLTEKNGTRLVGLFKDGFPVGP